MTLNNVLAERVHLTMATNHAGTMIDQGGDLVFGRPLLPDRELLFELLDGVLDSQQLTNGGQMLARLEAELETETGGEVCVTSSGTMALMMALRLGRLRPGGEVITSPLSFAASVQAIEWCGLRPVFADVEHDHPTLCPRAVERAITSNTVAIMGVHFLGIACDCLGLEAIAKQHGLWLVFDAAQSPDIVLEGRSLMLRGDASALSLHATKLLNTGEGGAVVVTDHVHKTKLDQMRNFGLENGRAVDIGVNGKLSEFNAAVGLAVLPGIVAEKRARTDLRAFYDQNLRDVPHIHALSPRLGSTKSHLYYTLSMPPTLCQKLLTYLSSKGITARGPFPLLCGPGSTKPEASTVSISGMPLAPSQHGRFLSLPLHSRVGRAGAEQIIKVIQEGLNIFDGECPESD